MKVKVRRTNRQRRASLRESWDALNPGRIDTEKGIVYGVKILGSRSKNGYGYSTTAMKQAAPLYEGIRVNIDHPTKADAERKSRSYADRFGHLRNVKYVEAKKGLFGDLHYNKKHRLTEQFEYDAQHAPNNMGLSHNARGDLKGHGKDAMVESINSVSSVDLVADPATGTGLFESRKTVRGKPKSKRRMESLAMELGDTPTTREALAKLVEAIIMDGSLSAKDRKEKILKCLEMDKDVTSRPNTSVEESERMKTKKTKTPNRRQLVESRKAQRALREAEKLRKELTARKRKDRVRALCESMQFKPESLQMKALLGMGTKLEAKKLIESFQGETRSKRSKKSQASNKPKSRSSEDTGKKRLSEAEMDNWIDGLME